MSTSKVAVLRCTEFKVGEITFKGSIEFQVMIGLSNPSYSILFEDDKFKIKSKSIRKISFDTDLDLRTADENFHVEEIHPELFASDFIIDADKATYLKSSYCGSLCNRDHNKFTAESLGHMKRELTLIVYKSVDFEIHPKTYE